MMPLKVISSQALLVPTVYEIEHIKKYRLLSDDRKCERQDTKDIATCTDLYKFLLHKKIIINEVNFFAFLEFLQSNISEVTS